MKGLKLLRLEDIIETQVIMATSRLLFRYSNFRPSHRDRFQEVNYYIIIYFLKTISSRTS